MHANVVGNPLFGREYEIVDIKRTYIEAELYCKGAGGHLPSVKSRAERNFMDEFASPFYNCNGRLVNAQRHTGMEY